MSTPFENLTDNIESENFFKIFNDMDKNISQISQTASQLHNDASIQYRKILKLIKTTQRKKMEKDEEIKKNNDIINEYKNKIKKIDDCLNKKEKEMIKINKKSDLNSTFDKIKKDIFKEEEEETKPNINKNKNYNDAVKKDNKKYNNKINQHVGDKHVDNKHIDNKSGVSKKNNKIKKEEPKRLIEK